MVLHILYAQFLRRSKSAACNVQVVGYPLEKFGFWCRYSVGQIVGSATYINMSTGGSYRNSELSRTGNQQLWLNTITARHDRYPEIQQGF